MNQRRLILVFLVASNLTLGRFPSQDLYSRPEAHGFADKFQPICQAIRRGDLASFRELLDFKHPNAPWFLHFRILLQIRHRCEVLLWRSLVRKTFLLNGAQGDVSSRRAPTVDLHDVLHLMRFLERRALFAEAGLADDGVNPVPTYVHPEFVGAKGFEPGDPLPDMGEIESLMSSLINQGFLNGFISHKHLRFAIQGAKKKGALAAGFPNVWQVIYAKVGDDDEVPGWKKAEDKAKDAPAGTGALGAQKYGPGMVVNLSGARPVGVAP